MRLADICTIKHGFAFKGSFFSDIDNGKVVLTPGNFKIGGGFQQARKAKFYTDEIPDEYLLDFGDLIVTMTDLSKKGDTLGFSALVPKDTNQYLHNQRIGLVEISSEAVSKNFLYWVMRTQHYHDFVVNTATGSTVKHTSPKSILAYEFDFPDLITQQKISKILDDIEAKIEANNNINRNLEEQSKALLNKYLVNCGSDTYLSEIMSFENGFAFKSKEYLDKGKYKIITIKHVKDGKIDSQGAFYINNIPQKMKIGCVLKPGDILLSLTGNVGRTGIVYEDNLLLNQRVAKIVSYDKILLPFLYFLFRSPFMKARLEIISKGTAQQNLSPIETLNLKIPFELKSALKLSIMLKGFFRQILLNQIETNRLSNLREYLLPKFMSGDLDISQIYIK